MVWSCADHLILQVKADRGEIDASEETIKKLQKETEEMANKSR